ncbi:hypothetical protein CGLO_10645 [Colletotrichum gloeosporioides Cg-14]|uniref:F-box domain-containing protein n=1 Tax=Colletotrichum gloeosporioides (strain Cg-14) TaxID=1237896 RepID=T0KD44_COLGC|nr:hypothetical protein CGLO_10645 [Colletotrichum gloeosporioides Cg-14]
MGPVSRFPQLWEDLLSPSPVAPASRLDKLWEESLWPEYTIRRIARATNNTPEPFRCVFLAEVTDYIDPAEEERRRRVQNAIIRARGKAELESRINQLQIRWNRNSPLFCMPKEVRDMIYDFLLLDTPRQEFISLEVNYTRHSRGIRRLRHLLQVCHDFRDELLSRFLGLNIVRMSLHASDFSASFPHIRRATKPVAPRPIFMAFLGRVKRFSLHHEGGGMPFWKDTTVKAGLLLAQSMPQLHELTIYPTEETTHLDGEFALFVLHVLTSPSLNKLVFFDTFDVVEEGDFEWAKDTESTCRIEVACLGSDEPAPRPARCKGRFLLSVRERCFSMMGIQFKIQPSLSENNHVKFVID